MQRRRLLAAGGALIALPPAFAHHGWSSLDQARLAVVTHRECYDLGSQTIGAVWGCATDHAFGLQGLQNSHQSWLGDPSLLVQGFEGAKGVAVHRCQHIQRACDGSDGGKRSHHSLYKGKASAGMFETDIATNR